MRRWYENLTYDAQAALVQGLFLVAYVAVLAVTVAMFAAALVP